MKRRGCFLIFFAYQLVHTASVVLRANDARPTRRRIHDVAGGKAKKKKREKRYPQAFRCWKDFIINKWRVCNWNRVMMLERRTGGSYRGGGGRVVRKSAGVCYYFTWRTLL